MEQREKLQLVIEQLEERIAPGGKHGGNNGFAYGRVETGEGGDGVPGHSGFQDDNR